MSMAVDLQRVKGIAEAIVEGSAVDWDHVLRSADDEEERRLIAQMQDLESIVQAHWRLLRT